jgi:membrane protease YdiL (CAAX protease family)
VSEKASLEGIIFTFILSLIVTWVAKSAGYYRLPSTHTTQALKLREVAGAFAAYFFISFIIVPLAVIAVNYFYYGQILRKSQFTKENLLWFQLGGFALIFIGLLIYLFLIKKETRDEILWGHEKNSTLKSMGLGVITLALAYPIVLFVSLVANFLSYYFFGKSGVEQGMVKEMKHLMQYPYLFSFMTVAVIFIAPFVEELLFRGFLQSYLRKFLGSMGAISVTAVIFSLAHYVRGGGAGNIELLFSLFVLACFLGFIYERQRNLFASFALHMTFNASTVIAIALR